MVRAIKFFLDDVAAIFSKHRRIKARGALLRYHIVFSWRVMTDTSATEESFFGFTAVFETYSAFYAHWRDMFINEIYCLPRLRSTPKIVDVGSNIGMSILYFKYLYPSAHIIAFEPSPANIAFLKKNIAVNNLSNVEVHESAAAERDGTVTMYIKDSESEGNSIWRDHADGGKPLTVKTETLNLYLHGVDFLKMDIEGSEYAVLRSVDLSGVVWIIVEAHQRPGRRNDGLHEILARLDRDGFRYCLQNTVPPWSFVEDFERGYDTCLVFGRNTKIVSVV